MYKEIAFDPHCLKEYHYYGILKGAFGEERGRYIVAVVNQWLEEAFAVVKDSEIQDVKKKSMKNYLNNLRKKKGGNTILLPAYRKSVIDPESVKTWHEWFDEQRKFTDFDATVSDRNIGGALSYEDIIGECDGWSVPPTIRIDRTAEAIAEALVPLLRFGSQVILIDQYFRLAGNAVLHELISFISSLGSIKKITIVTSVDTADPAKVFASEYLGKYDCLPKFDLVVAPEKFFHDRYLLTENSAVKTGQGFSSAPKIGAHADRLSLNLCGTDEKKETEADLSSVINRGIAKVVELN
jgi:hypothetical protein